MVLWLFSSLALFAFRSSIPSFRLVLVAFVRSENEDRGRVLRPINSLKLDFFPIYPRGLWPCRKKCFLRFSLVIEMADCVIGPVAGMEWL